MVKTKHIFQLSRIVDKMGLSADVKNILAMAKKEKLNEDTVGTELIMSVVSKVHLAEKEFYTLLADVSGKTVKDIEDSPPREMIAMVKELLSEEGVLDFLSSQQVDLKST